jgi:hypothetical protein
MNLQEIVKIPKPYRSENSRNYSGIDIIYDETILFTLPNGYDNLHKIIVGALNGAFMEGCFYRDKMNDKFDLGD